MERRSGTRSLIGAACLAIAGAAAVAILVFGVSPRALLPYGMLVLCPLMHLFMGHGAHGRDPAHAPDSADTAPTPAPHEH